MRTEYLRYFITVVQEESISKASKKLHINHQALSRIIRNLEFEFNTIIFSRNTKGVELTPDGIIIVEKVTQILDILDETLALFQASPSIAAAKSKTLGVYAAHGIQSRKFAKSIIEFSALYPNINVSYFEEDYHKILTVVQEAESNVGILQQFSRPNLPVEPAIPESLAFIPLYRNKLVVLGAKNHPLMQKSATTTLKAIQKLSFVYYQPFTAMKEPYKAIFSPLAPPTVKYIVNDIDAYYGILQQGTCIALGNKILLDEYASKDIVTIPLRDNISVTVGLLVKKSELDELAVQAYINFCNNAL